MDMRMSEKGTGLLAQWEGIECRVYKDVAGLATIGVGHLLTAQELSSGTIRIGTRTVAYGNGIENRDVMDLLGQDLARFEGGICKLVAVPLTQNQFDALVSFTFNVGLGAFQSSTLLKRLNARAYDEVPDQLRRWTKAGDKTVQGLVNRRENEIKLWSGLV